MSTGQRPLSGQVAWITGASRGIGRAIVDQLAADGAHLALSARRRESVEGVAEELGTRHPEQRFLALGCDVSRADEVAAALENILGAFDRIDILVNNAGITRDGLVLRMKDEDWDAVIDTNLKGTFLTCRPVAKAMVRRRSGRIVNITSVVGLTGNIGQANYAASKGGVIALTYSLAKELAARGITVNAVAPGFIDTDMTKAMTDDAKSAVSANIPLGRMGTGAEIASVVGFLCGPGASYMTGQVVKVDGGLAIG